MIPSRLIRRFQPVLIGSSGYGMPGGDVDILIAVPESEIPAVEAALLGSGFIRNIPEPSTTDPLVRSAFSCGYADIQIATPADYAKKRKAHEFIRAQRLYVGRTKRQRYRLYRSIYEVMQ